MSFVCVSNALILLFILIERSVLSMTNGLLSHVRATVSTIFLSIKTADVELSFVLSRVFGRRKEIAHPGCLYSENDKDAMVGCSVGVGGILMR